jgi:transglutaminase-like putative cysteine protease
VASASVAIFASIISKLVPMELRWSAFREQVGFAVIFTHLAITLCRCMNIPARYATGYLGDIGVPADPNPMDFSAWFEVFLQGRWYAFDARHNRRRIGRVLLGLSRDAADVPITMSFGKQTLEVFRVITEEIDLAAVSDLSITQLSGRS